MANNSIKNAFEIMWQYVVNKMNDKADIEHIQEIEKGGTGATTVEAARTNLGITYSETAPTVAPDTGEGTVCFVKEDNEPTPIEEGGTGAITATSAIQNLGMYPVGAVYVSSTNENPASYLGGTWELFDKSLARYYYTATNNPQIVSVNENTTYHSVAITVDGHSIFVKCIVAFSGTFLESNRNALTINFNEIGITRITAQANGHGGSDDGNAIVLGSIAYSSGVVSLTQAVAIGGSSIPADTNITIDFVANVGMNYMLDEFCDKFYWKRTA